MKKVYDMVATTGEYTNNAGEKKKRYVNIGSVLERDDGSLCAKLDVIPVSPEWSTWINFFVPKARGENRTVQTPATSAAAEYEVNLPPAQSSAQGEKPPF